VRKILSAALLAAGAALAYADGGEASRLRSEQATAVLEAVVGAGRGRVVVEASVELVETRAEFGVAGAGAAARPETPLPGYRRKSTTGQALVGGNRTVHATSGVVVRSLKAAVFVDQALSEELVRRGTEAVAEILGLDESRGDELKLVRAPLSELPPPPRDWHAVSGGALAAAALAGAIVLALSVRGAAARLAGALTDRQAAPVTVTIAAPPPQLMEVHVPSPPPSPAPPAPPPASSGPVRRIEILPRLGDKERS